MKKLKKKKERNPFVIDAKKRKSGKMRNKKNKRKKNKEIEILKEETEL